MSKIAVFVDYDNVAIALDRYYQIGNDRMLKLEIIQKIKEYFKDDKILMIKAFADFEKITPLLTPLQKEQVELRHVYSSNKRKNASDIALAISVMKSVYSNHNVDKYVIVSSDSDMLPIINEMSFFDKEIFVIYSEYCAKNEYETYLDTDSFVTIEELLGLPLYVPIVENQIITTLAEKMNMINAYISEIYKKYKNKGTVGRKDLIEKLYEIYSDYCASDVDIIVDYLFRNDLLIESDIKNTKYKKVLINPDALVKYNVDIDGKIVSEDDYIDEIQ